MIAMEESIIALLSQFPVAAVLFYWITKTRADAAEDRTYWRKENERLTELLIECYHGNGQDEFKAQ